jgi:hypothetical protein
VEKFSKLKWLDVNFIEKEVLAGLSLLPEDRAVEMLERVAKVSISLFKKTNISNNRIIIDMFLYTSQLIIIIIIIIFLLL